MLKNLVRSFSNHYNPTEVVFFVNGKKHVVENVNPEDKLLEYLREEGNKSIKTCCGEGACGFCTIVAQEIDDEDNISTYQIDSCAYPLFMADGKHLLTSEGMKEQKQVLKKVQEFYENENVFQCGFCTPGFMLNIYSEILKNPEIGEDELVDSLKNNTCRCTGYRPIIDATQKLAKEIKTLDFEKNEAQIIFPKELRDYFNQTKNKVLELHLDGRTIKYVRPTNISSVFEALQKGAKPIGGGVCWIGMELFEEFGSDYIVDLKNIKELNVFEQDDEGVTIGSAMTLAELTHIIKRSERNSKNKKLFEILDQIMFRIGTAQINNISTVGGNIFNLTKYTSDLLLLAHGTNAVFKLVNAKGEEREILAADNTNFPPNISKDEILVSIKYPFVKENSVAKFFKQYKRKSNDIPIINTVMHLDIQDNSNVINSANLAFGGFLNHKYLRLTETENFLKGKELTHETYNKALEKIQIDIDNNAQYIKKEGMEEYKKSLIFSYFTKIYFQYKEEKMGGIDARTKSAIEENKEKQFKSKIDYQTVQVGTSLGKSEKNVYAKALCNGEAQFVNDISPSVDELISYIVYSPIAHGKIISIDTTKALEMEGVVDWVDCTDIKGENWFSGLGFTDEEFFAEGKVRALGQPIGIIVAEDLKLAKEAAKKIDFKFEELPSILSIDEAIENESFFDFWPQLQRGKPREIIAEARKTGKNYLSGEFDIGGQRHMYGETQSSIAIPQEDDEILIFVATQDLAGCQAGISQALEIPKNKITCKSKRMGGAFGGKQSRGAYFGALNAIAAKKVGRPTRMVLERRDDTIMSAGRHPWKAKYEVVYTPEGKIEAMELNVYQNGGFCIELSIPVLEHGFSNIDGPYFIPNQRLAGYCCKTNYVSPSAFRGFGLPQCCISMDNVLDEVAHKIGMDPYDVKKANLYKETDVTPYGQSLEEERINEIWKQLYESTEYQKRREAVEEFNANNKYKKRGIGVVPLKYGFSYSEAPFLNHGSSLVNIFTDGTVGVHVGGTEMGQGLMTKVCQVVATGLNCPFENVYVTETNTAVTPNAAATAASIGSDVYSGAAYDAAVQLFDRLEPFMKELNYPEEASFADVAITAWLNTTNLSAQGYYKLRDLNPVHWPSEPNVETPPGPEYDGIITPYFIYGASFAEVEIDCLTGENTIQRADLIMDLGNSQSPEIDIGQSEGGFVQGIGWCTMEEQIMGGNMGNDWYEYGKYFTQNLDTYKIPLSDDMPTEFNVSLLKDSPCEYGFMRSKCSGEPPLFLGSCAFMAIKDAIYSYREQELGLDSTTLNFHSPATVEKIRIACTDSIVENVLKSQGLDQQQIEEFSIKSSL